MPSHRLDRTIGLLQIEQHTYKDFPSPTDDTSFEMERSGIISKAVFVGRSGSLLQIFEHFDCDALYFAVFYENVIQFRIFRMESDAMLFRFGKEPFERRFIVDQRDYDLSLVGVILLPY